VSALPDRTKLNSLLELAVLFLRLGVIGFGGPAAHISLMREEIVHRKKWLDDRQFLDLNGATNLIPGPNSTEMVIHIGNLRAGTAGLIVAGISFILPAMLIVMGISWIYVRYSRLPEAGWLLYGVKPVVIAIIIQAIVGLSRTAVKNILLGFCGVAVALGYFLSINEILLLLLAGLIVMLVKNAQRIHWTQASLIIPMLSIPAQFASQAGYTPWIMFITFIKIGSILYGSGYVLIAYLQAEFVNRLGWLTSEQIIDAITIGQITPGPVFTTATFIGYILGGPVAAILATIGIFLPAFVFVAISHPFIPRLRASPWFGSFLDGVNVASLGLMAAVCWQLGRDTLVDWYTLLIGLLSLIFLLRFKINPTWLILGGLVAGIIKHLIAG
jgi:chromate transporter